MIFSDDYDTFEINTVFNLFLEPFFIKFFFEIYLYFCERDLWNKKKSFFIEMDLFS